jgi:small subunit ribosomal protein S8e
VRTRGGNRKFRALRLDTGNFAWASQGLFLLKFQLAKLLRKNLTSKFVSFLGTARKTRILDVVYNASNNELVRTKTLVKNCIITIDATPFKQWYEAHYLLPLGRKKDGKPSQPLAEGEEDVLAKKRSAEAVRKYTARQKYGKVETALEEQFLQGRLLGKLFVSRLFYL